MSEIYDEFGIGWAIPRENFDKRFGVHVTELSHMEPRWDPKTGKQLPNVKVIDIEEQDCWRLVHEDDDSDLIDDFMEALNQFGGMIGANVFSDYNGDDSIIYVTVKSTETQEDRDTGMYNQDITNFKALEVECQRLWLELMNYKLHPQDAPGVVGYANVD